MWEAVEPGAMEYHKDRMSLYTIYQAVREHVTSTLAGKDTGKLAWEAIKTAHMGHERVREANL